MTIDPLNPVKIVVLVSGGKDSQLCAKIASQTGLNLLGLFCDTGFEHPKTYQHIERIAELYQIPIQTLRGDRDMEGHILVQRAFPAPWQRSCTSRLKTRPTARFLGALAKEQGAGFEVWFGMRTGESKSRAQKYGDLLPDDLFAPHELSSDYPKSLEKDGILFRLPIVNLSDEDVFSALGDEINPLYREGFNRVGCFPCLISSHSEHHRAFMHDEFGARQKRKLIRIEQAIGKKHKTANTSQQCMFCQI